MRRALRKITLLINPISTPIQIGIYQNDKLICVDEMEGRASNTLLKYFENIPLEYNVTKIIYLNGPGSYMAIKLTYIMLKTIELIRNIPFYGCSAFELNDDRPVRAIGNLYFIKEKETIITKKFEEKVMQEYNMPESINNITLEDSNIPHYILPAV